jgi:hypothetical protein
MFSLPQNHADDLGEPEIHKPQSERHDHRDDNHNGGGRNGLLGRGPRHLLQLRPGFLQELLDDKPDLFYLVQRFALYGRKWQARRDSNPQHPDLESGALAIRATGLCTSIASKSRTRTLLRLSVNLVRAAESAVFLQFQTILHRFLILRRRVILLLTVRTGQRDNIPHDKSNLIYRSIEWSPRPGLNW